MCSRKASQVTKGFNTLCHNYDTNIMKRYYASIFTTLMVGAIIFPGTAFAVNNTLVPDVFVSSDALLQADTLLVTVKNEPQTITGKLGAVTLHFFRNETGADWVCIVGMPVNKKPGTYQLIINVETKTPFIKDITVLKRDFPVTELTITPDLIQKGYTAKKIISNIQNQENLALNKVLSAFTKKVYFTKPFISPLSEIRVVGDFGDIRATGNYKIQHLGVDLKALTGTNVYAVNDGKIVFEKNLPDYGNTLIIDHGLGVYSLYLHLSKFNIKVGEIVKQGDIIALSGATGYATGPHLHFSIKVRGSALDPLKFVQATQSIS